MSGTTAATAARAARLVAALPATVRVGLDALQRAHATSFPELVATPGARDDLEALVRAAATAGLLELPAEPGASWDRARLPALPTFVNRPDQRRTPAPGTSPTAELRGRVWHPGLAWAARLGQVTTGQLADLDAVDVWLRTHDPDGPVVAREERSLEVFGDEKHVKARLGSSSVWSPGRIDEQLLRCVAPVPPMPVAPLADRGTLLVVENRATFWSCVGVLRSRTSSVAAVGWGQGNYLATLVPSMAQLPIEVTRVVYFGDLDQRGLRFPADADAVARAHGLPPVEPAASLYALLETHAVVGRDRDGAANHATAEELASWLPEPRRLWAEQLLRDGRRCAQEAVGVRVLSLDAHWHSAL